jgi:hypothetical protein
MRTFVRSAATLLTLAVLCQAASVLADDYYWVTGNGQKPAGEKTAPQDNLCNPCDPACCPDEGCGCGCGSCDPCGCVLGCEEGPTFGMVGMFGFDSFKGISDLEFNSNFGAVTGLNAAMPVLANRSIGWQLGMTYGAYDWSGAVPIAGRKEAAMQQQVFVTTGFFRKAHDDQRLSFGLVYDWMINDQWGFLGTNPTMGQWRGQAEWALSGCNAVGVYGCLRDRFADQVYTINDVRFNVRNRSVTQVDLFWHHKFNWGGDSWIWIGVPEKERLNELGSLGDWIVGAKVEVPLSDYLALYGNAQYMHPSASAGTLASAEEAWNIGAGVVWYFGGHAHSHAINGKCWTPYMPVANNSTFLVDQGITELVGN